jgi:RNA polymerase sigma factor (sigma-70 family)
MSARSTPSEPPTTVDSDPAPGADAGAGDPPAAGAGHNRGTERIGALLREARVGHRPALHLLVEELTPMVWNIARAQGLDRASCEDVVQTAWLALLQHLHEIRTPAALLGWLTTVTRREAWRLQGLAARWRPPAEDGSTEPADPDPLPDELVTTDERGRLLWAAVRRLPGRCPELLRVIAFTPRPDYAVVAAALAMPRGSIGPTRGRCLAKLRAELAADPRWGEP